MKGKIIYFVILTVLLLTVVSYAEITVETKCQDYLCVEGTPVTYNISVLNDINETVVVHDLFVIDKNTRDILSFYNDKTFILPEGESVSVVVKDDAKMPSSGYTYYFVPCINVSKLGNDSSSEYVCGRTIKTLTITPREKVECVSDEDCRDDQMCNRTHYCQELYCADDQAIIPHQCLDLSCTGFSTAKNHECVSNNAYMYYAIGAGALIVILILFFIFGRRKEKSVILDSKGKPARVVKRRKSR